ncbi:MAG: class I SAM-dependent methyltransferase [Pikeienuella sp.]
MPDIEAEIAGQNTSGALLAHSLAGLRTLDIDPDDASADDLAPADEFHTGGRRATDDLLAQLRIDPVARALDIGCGIGGPARHVAARTGAHVTGIDLTPEFIETARELSARVGLADLTDFHVGSALEAPFADESFDLAIMLHVGMNIADKTRLMTETKRMLRPGGTFAIFDVMREEGVDAPLTYPLPWSRIAETSFVAPPSVYERAARAAGFAIVATRARREFALDFFAQAAAAAKTRGPAPLGLHLVMGADAGRKVGNYVADLKAGLVAPVELILRA